jgi:hypothetical protein
MVARQARVVCPKHLRATCFPLLGQSIAVPLVVMCDGREQSDRERVEFELLQDAVNEVGPFAVLAYAVECVACGLHRQCWDVESLAVGGMVEMRDVIQRHTVLN